MFMNFVAKIKIKLLKRRASGEHALFMESS